MNRPPFPECRPDGTLCVAARFSCDAPEGRSAAEATVQEWIANQGARGIDLSVDLASEPFVVAREAGTFDVVFEGRARATRWKDWLVSLALAMDSTPGITRQCFFDLVADRPHPASLTE